MNVLVTGGTGFVGGHLVPKLIDKGYNVKCLVRDERKGQFLKNKYNVEIVIGDVTKPETLMGLSDGIEYVVHMAAMGHVNAVTEESFKLFTGINEGGTKNLVEEFSKSDTLKRFVHFSSTAAMGPIGIPILNEESIPNPITPYQKSKNRSEAIVIDAYNNSEFPGVIVRPCMIYGVGGYGEFYKFCNLMKKGVFPKVGFGKNLTPLVHVEDVVQGAILAMEKGKNGQKYILASDTSIEMDEMHRLIMKSIGKKSPYIFVPAWMALSGARFVEWFSPKIGKEPIATYNNIKSTVIDRTFDISKAKKELGYSVKIPFEKGIDETIKWYKKQGRL